MEFLGIGLKDSKEACQAFVRKHGLTFPNAYDGSGKVAQAYGFSYQPYWAVIDRNGALLRAGFGPANEQELVNTVRALTK